MEELHKFLKYQSRRRYNKGEVILQQDELPGAVYIVKTGIVKTYNLTINGEEKPISFHVKDAAFPVGRIGLKTERTLYYYEALTDCELYVVPHYNYVIFLQNNPEALLRAYHNLVDSNIEYQMRVNALEQSKAKDKVLSTLLFLVYRYGSDNDEQWAEIQIPFTQQDIANFMGLARETAAIELKKLEREGVITYRNRCYMVQTLKLQELLGEDNEMSYEFEAYSPPKATVKLIDKFKNAYGKTYK